MPDKRTASLKISKSVILKDINSCQEQACLNNTLALGQADVAVTEGNCFNVVAETGDVLLINMT